MAEAVDFKWYRYTADDGTFYALKVDKTWGDDADSGFAAFNTADPGVAPGPSFRPRSITLQDTVSGRVTRKYVGSVTAAAWTTSGFTQALPVRGGGGTVLFTKIGQNGERIRRPRTIISKPEPVSA